MMRTVKVLSGGNRDSSDRAIHHRREVKLLGGIKYRIGLVIALVCLGSQPGVTAAIGEGDGDAVRGIIRAEVTATISSELVAQIVALPVKSGEAFKRGATLVEFNCSRYEADMRAARAEVQASDITVKQNRQLLRRGAGGSNDLAISEAKLAQSQAALDALAVQLTQCVIKAPFDGRVAERFVDVFELPGANKPLLKIVKDGNLEIDLIVPSNWVVWLETGKRFEFAIDETGTAHEAEVARIGALVDPISRTIRVTARLLSHDHLVRPGMSGSATFEIERNAGDGGK